MIALGVAGLAISVVAVVTFVVEWWKSRDFGDAFSLSFLVLIGLGSLLLAVSLAVSAIVAGVSS